MKVLLVVYVVFIEFESVKLEGVKCFMLLIWFNMVVFVSFLFIVFNYNGSCMVNYYDGFDKLMNLSL